MHRGSAQRRHAMRGMRAHGVGIIGVKVWIFKGELLDKQNPHGVKSGGEPVGVEAA